MYRISSKQCDECIKIFSTLSAVRLVSKILLKLNILCTSAVKLHYAENNNLPFMCSYVKEFIEANLPPVSMDLSRLISHSGSFAAKPQTTSII